MLDQELTPAEQDALARAEAPGVDLTLQSPPVPDQAERQAREAESDYDRDRGAVDHQAQSRGRDFPGNNRRPN
jgi:hypothetical protein